MLRHKRELVLLYFDGVVHKLPHELWWICLELSGLVRILGNSQCLWWHIHIPRFVFSQDLYKWRRRNPHG